MNTMNISWGVKAADA